MSTNVAIFFFRPAAVLVSCIRKASANRFRALSADSILPAFGSASMAVWRSRVRVRGTARVDGVAEVMTGGDSSESPPPRPIRR